MLTITRLFVSRRDEIEAAELAKSIFNTYTKVPLDCSTKVLRAPEYARRLRRPAIAGELSSFNARSLLCQQN